MDATSNNTALNNSQISWLPLIASIVALIGLGDAVYLTVHHFNGVSVQCTVVTGCEEVLNSPYAQIAGVPLALIGALAYFVVFSLAILAAFGNRRAWQLFGLTVSFMAVFTVWLIYLQGIVIKAFCQFCLISAAVTFTLFIIYLLSRYFFKRLA